MWLQLRITVPQFIDSWFWQWKWFQEVRALWCSPHLHGMSYSKCFVVLSTIVALKLVQRTKSFWQERQHLSNGYLISTSRPTPKSTFSPHPNLFPGIMSPSNNFILKELPVWIILISLALSAYNVYEWIIITLMKILHYHGRWLTKDDEIVLNYRNYV